MILIPEAKDDDEDDAWLVIIIVDCRCKYCLVFVVLCRKKVVADTTFSNALNTEIAVGYKH